MPEENYTSKFRVDVSDLKKGLSEANQAIKKANAEFKNATAGMGDWEKSADGLNAKITQQKKLVEEEQKKLDLLREQLARLNKSQEDGKKTISDLNSKYDEAVKKYGATSEEAKKYAKQLSDAEAAQERNRKAAEKLELQIINQDTAVKNAKSDIAKYEGELNSLETEQKQDKTATENLNESIEDTGKQAQKTTDGGLSTFTVALGNLAANVITAVISKLGDLGKAAIDSFEEFEKGSDAVIKATGATGEQADELRKAYSNAAKQVEGDMESIGEATGAVNTRLGFTGEKLTEATTQFAKFAEITGTDATTAVELVSRAMGDAGIEADNYSEVLDKLAKASQGSGISVDKLAESLTKYGAPMRALGFDTNESIALFSQWEKAGVNTEIAFSGMKKAISSWAAAGKDAKEEFKKTLDEIAAAPDIAAATTQAIEVFGQKAGPDLADAIQGGRFEYSEFLKLVESSQDTVAKTYEETESGLDKLKLATQSLKVTAGELVSGVFEKISPDIDKLLSGFNALIAGEAGAAETIGEAVGNIAVNIITTLTDLIPKAVTIGAKLLENVATGILSALPDFIKGITQAITSLLRSLGSIIPNVIDAFLEVLPALNAALYNAIPQIITGLIQFVTSLIDSLPDIIEQALQTAPQVWQAITEAIQTNLPIIITAVEGLIKSLTKAMPKILKTLTKELPNLIKTYMEVLSTTYPIVIQAAIDLLGAIIDALPQIITAWQDAAPDLVEAIGQAIIDNAPLLWECVKQVWSALFSAIPDLLLSLLEGLWAIITGALKAWARILTPVATWIYDNIISPVGDFFSDMWEGFKDKAAKAWEGVKSIFSKVAGFFGEKFGEAWQKVKDIFSTGGRVFDGIKEGIERAFTSTVNAIIRGINRVVSIPFTNINEVLDKLRKVEILGLNPFENLIGNISIPQIPELAYGGILKRGQLGLLEGKNDEAVIPLQNNIEGMRRIAGMLAEEMGGGVGSAPVNNYTFTQTNNSPKALSRWDIYRQTKNLMNAMKGV